MDHVVGVKGIDAHDVHAPRALVKGTMAKRGEILLQVLLVLAVWIVDQEAVHDLAAFLGLVLLDAHHRGGKFCRPLPDKGHKAIHHQLAVVHQVHADYGAGRQMA